MKIWSVIKTTTSLKKNLEKWIKYMNCNLNRQIFITVYGNIWLRIVLRHVDDQNVKIQMENAFGQKIKANGRPKLANDRI